MRRVWPELDSRIELGALTARGWVCPSPVTRAYQTHLVYRECTAPQVFVLSPRLIRRAIEPDTPIPHTYGALEPGQEQPCLYYPFSREWTPAKPLARTIMPWLLAWLIDYELWLATGEWLGGGMPHGNHKSLTEPPVFAEGAA